MKTATVKRIIPCLDVQNGRVVKGKQFTAITDVADPLQLAKAYSIAGADELVMYDIAATHEGRSIFLDLVESIAEQVTIPFTVGGGIRTFEDAKQVLRVGADKVSINSAAVKNTSLIREISEYYGPEAVVLAIDAQENQDGKWSVVINGGRLNTGKDVVSWAQEGERLGAGEIVLNVINTDGLQTGYELELTRQVAESVQIPVIASGGAGKVEDFLQVLTAGKADGALAASVFHYGTIKIQALKQYLAANGIKIEMGQFK